MNQNQTVKLNFTGARRRRTISRTLFWFPLLNLIAIEYLFGNWKDIGFLSSIVVSRQKAHPNSGEKTDLPSWLLAKSNQDTATDTALTKSQKGGLNVTRVTISPIVEFPKSIGTQYDQNASDIPAGGVDTPDGFNPAEALDKDTEVTGKTTGPLLRKDPITGIISIGNYKSLTVSSSQQNCLGLGRSMLRDIRAPADQLSVMMSNGQISIAKICADNGSVIITCRGGKMVVSPRRIRPDDKCVRS